MCRSFVVVVLVAITLTATAHAQRADTAALEQDLAELRAEVAELRALAVQAGTNGTAVQELSERLAILAQEVDTLRRQRASVPDAIAVIDQLTVDLDALEQEVAGLRTRLADLDQPWAPASGGAGGAGGYRDGFLLGTADGAYALRLTGYAQTRYQLEVADGDLETSTFAMRRARIGARGHLGSEDVQYKILAELLDAPALRDYYVDWQAARGLWIRVGQDKVQFTRSFITSSSKLAFPERPGAIDAFGYGRDPGVSVHGALAGDRIGYSLGLSNGAGENRRNDNIDFLVAARLDAALLGERIDYGYGDLARSSAPRIAIGAGLAHDLVRVPASLGGVPVQDPDVDDDDDVDNIRVVSASADLIGRYKGLEVTAEAVLRWEDWGSILEGNGLWADLVGPGATHMLLGAYGQATYFVVPERWLIGARVGRYEQPILALGGQEDANPTFAESLEADALVQLYWRGARLLGLQYTLASRDSQVDGVGDLTAHRVILEGQLQF